MHSCNRQIIAREMHIACSYLVIDLVYCVYTALRHRHHFSALNPAKSNRRSRDTRTFPASRVALVYRLVGSDNITLNRKSLIRITDSRRCLGKKCDGWEINKRYRREARERIDCGKMSYEHSLARLCIPYAMLQRLITRRLYIHYVVDELPYLLT